MTSELQPQPSAEDGREPSGPAAASQQFVTFKIGDEDYGVDIMKVREINGWSPTTALPHSPAHVRGVVNLRGVIVPIFDLRQRFGMGLTEPTRTHVVIIVRVGAKTLGILADGVSDIIAVEPAAIRPVPDIGVAGGDHFLQGLVALDGRMVTLVSLEGLFEAAETRPAAAASPH